MDRVVDLGRERYISLTTFRRDESPIATAVWVVADSGRLYVWTGAQTRKAKRIRHNPAVTVAPCTARGMPTRPAVQAQAQIVPLASRPQNLAAAPGEVRHPVARDPVVRADQPPAAARPAVIRTGLPRADTGRRLRSHAAVAKACFGGPATWRAALEAQGVSGIGDLMDWEELGRLWEDRNVIAHRGSVVDARHGALRMVTEWPLSRHD
jgi:Pyridoxamine 5'-phosphate oxidase